MTRPGPWACVPGDGGGGTRQSAARDSREDRQGTGVMAGRSARAAASASSADGDALQHVPQQRAAAAPPRKQRLTACDRLPPDSGSTCFGLRRQPACPGAPPIRRTAAPAPAPTASAHRPVAVGLKRSGGIGPAARVHAFSCDGEMASTSSSRQSGAARHRGQKRAHRGDATTRLPARQTPTPSSRLLRRRPKPAPRRVAERTTGTHTAESVDDLGRSP